MTTPKKRLDATIASLAARVDVSPHRPTRPSSPLVRTPKHSKLKTSAVTPSPSRKRAQPCDRSKDLYNKICKGLIDSTRTPPRNKNLTPTKFFKSRIAAAPASKNLGKRVLLLICDEPVEYIKDVENMNQVGGRNRKRRSVAVEMVMPLYNIKTGVDAHEHVEIVADVVDEIFDESTRGKTKKQKSRQVKTGKIQKVVGQGVPTQPSTSSCKSEEYELPIYSFEGNIEENTEFNKTASKRFQSSVIKSPAAGSIKRKGSTQKTEPSKKRKTVVYNEADSSDEEDVMFISTIKPILSEEENEEMQKILGKSDDATEIDTAKEDVGVRRQRKEGNL